MIDVALLKTKINCVEYAQKYMLLPIRKAGDRCVSPFRAGAKNRNSFLVDINYFYDFGSSFGGDVIDMCALHNHDGNRGDAIYDLAEKTGIYENDTQYSKWQKAIQDLCNTIQTWHEDLREEDKDYLHKRAITDETITELKIGFNNNRIIIPYFKNGYVYSWCGRTTNNADPKYLKPKNNIFSEPFPWGMNTLNRESDTIYIAEGAFDALSIYQSGYPVLATMGGHFSKGISETVANICKGYNHVILTFDNDDAGIKFTKDFGKILIDKGIMFEIAKIPNKYKDISDYYAAGNDIKSLRKSNGLAWIGKEIKDKETFRAFAFKCARRFDSAEIAELFHFVKKDEHFSAAWLDAIERKVNKCPSDTTIVKGIIQKHKLLYNDNESFYEYFPQHGRWKMLSEQTIHSYIVEELGVFAAGAKLTPIKNLLKPAVFNSQAFNKNPLVNFQNGTLELESGVFREASENDMISIQLPYNYNAKADCPHWKRFIKDITNNDEKSMSVLREIAGYTLFSDCPYEKLFVLIGNGGNGKSRYTMVLQKLFGEENVTNIKPAGLIEPFEIIHLKNSLINISGEIASDLSRTEERLKEIASGETVQGCYKGKDFIRFNPRAKLVFCCNNQLRASDTSDGLARRLVIVNFPCSFVEVPDPSDPFQKKADIHLLGKLLKELSGIFNWAYEGYKELKNVGYFDVTDEQAELIQQFKESSNPVLLFVNEFLEEFERDTITYTEVYNRYRNWCDDTGHKPLANNRFHAEFQKNTRNVFYVGKEYKRINGEPRRTRVYTRISQTDPEWVKELL